MPQHGWRENSLAQGKRLLVVWLVGHWSVELACLLGECEGAWERLAGGIGQAAGPRASPHTMCAGLLSPRASDEVPDCGGVRLWVWGDRSMGTRWHKVLCCRRWGEGECHG